MKQFNCMDFVMQEASSWKQTTVNDYRFGGKELLLGTREIGHVHPDGKVDVEMGQAIKAVLISEGKAQPHNLYPDSGMVTFHVHARGDVYHALWLLKLGYMLQLIRQQHQHPALSGDMLTDIREQLDALNLSEPLQACFDELLATLSP